MTACAGFDPTQLIDPVPIGPTTPATIEATPTTPAVAPEAPAAITATPAPTPITGPLPAAPTDWESLDDWLVGLWQGGVNPAAVRAALRQSGMQRSDDDWRAADLDGDLQDEWIVVLYDPSLPGVPFGAAGDLWLVSDEGVAFRYYPAPSSDIYDFLAPTIVDVADMTGDGRPELIASTTLCGAHTCFDDIRVIGLTPDGPVDLVRREPAAEGDPGNAVNMSYPEARVEDSDGDSVAELVVHGGTLGSAGSGVVRPRTEIWRWDGEAVTLAETLLDPTGYRHHVLYEANDLMAAGDLDGALALYEAAINDPALRNDGFAHAPEAVYADISRFAAFRLILIDLLRGDDERAAGRLAWLQANHPAAAATAAAETLIGGWAGEAALAALCEQIEAQAEVVDGPTGTLADMGYGNPSLGAADFCP